ncbi:unnamed protein product [Arabidopsis arenosa]|uniref:Uncharacterized protein n=1 Tax=Arabidopsis arenosa TaxID=38785 RepID=A0A8S2AWF3_ARAAE|nr:unnamed protein product [Arabidopsis arenosa]
MRQSIGSTASTISAQKAIPVKSNPVILASRSSVDADSPVSVHTPFFNELVVRKSTRSTASTDSTPISPPVVVNQASGASRAVTSAGSLDLVQSRSFIQPDRFRISLGCSTDRSTAASMVIAHKVGRCAGKASLYAWNYFISEDFSSDLMRSTSVIVNDLMTDFEIDLDMLFPGLVELIASTGMILVNDKIFGDHSWLDLKVELMLLYGYLPRPPESYFTFCSSHRFTDLVCSCIMLLESLACDVDFIMLMNLGGLQVIAPLANGSFSDFYTIGDAASVQHLNLWFCLITLAKKHAYATVDFGMKYSKMIASTTRKPAIWDSLL